MRAIAKKELPDDLPAESQVGLSKFVPAELKVLADIQTAIPRIAKDTRLIQLIERAVQNVPTTHSIFQEDARIMGNLESQSVHLVLTSPPYWTLKDYRDSDGQLGHVEDYDQFLRELDKVWAQCFDASVPGARLICVVGDVCLPRRENGGGRVGVPALTLVHNRSLPPCFAHVAPN